MSKKIKEDIISVATDILAQDGIDELSFGAIASAVQVSEEEIRTHFSTREELIVACFENERIRVKQILQLVHEHTDFNVLDKIVLCMSKMYYFQSILYNISVKDLQDLPEALEMVLTIKSKLYMFYLNYFSMAVDEGYLVKEVKYEAIVAMIIDKTTDHVDNSKQLNQIITILKGLCTDKGNAVLSKYTPNKY